MLEIFQIPFMQKALIISCIAGSFFSFLSVYIVLRRIVFVGIALSQIAACGFSLGYLLGISPSVCSIIFSLLGVAVFSFQQSERIIPRESIIGLTYALAASLAILFAAKNAKAEAYALNLLSGNILTVTNSQIYLVLAVFSGATLLHYLFYKQFIFISFDLETAATCGLNTGRWNFLFYVILGVTISIGMRTLGILLTFGYLVLPALIALVFVQRIKKVFIVAVLSCLITTFLGLYLSFKLDIPSGPGIVTLLCFILGVSYLFRKSANIITPVILAMIRKEK
ncbi:metal ABC transporter permease [bacterium]|nr:metal ABC transporter permease [bacterium]MBU4134673.1 metal ABC transporter permease [bacterium]